MNIAFVLRNSAAMILVRRGLIRNLSSIAKFPSRHTEFLNELGLSRDPEGSVLGILFDTKYTEPPNIIYLACGLPSPCSFPFEKASFKMKNNRIIHLDQDTMLKGMQYGPIEGYRPLIDRLKSYMNRFHNVTDWQAIDLVVCGGATDSLSRCLELILDEDVFLLAEEPLFGTIATYIETYRSQYKRIERDELGMTPHSLKETLLDILQKEQRVKKLVLYVNYMTMKRSATTELSERLEALYKVAQEFDILIIEVDPHFLLHIYNDYHEIVPSFLRLDTDERVLRCDSTSVIFGPGLRIGCVTGPRPFTRLICSHIDGSMIHASQLSQVLISKTIEESGEEELKKYSINIYEKILSERHDLEVAAKSCLENLDYTLYPEFPFIWFKVEKTTKLIKHIQDEGSQIKFTLSPYSLSSNEKCITLGLSFAGLSLEQMKKVCCKICEILTERA